MIIITIRRPTSDRFNAQQHIQALSMRNKDEFLERMTAAAPVVEELANVKPSTWRDMRGLFTSMALVGGMNMLGNFTGRMQQAAMFPMNVITNRVGFMLEGLMMPLMPIVNKAIMSYESFVMANQTGALIGGGIGFIVGNWLPGGPILWGLIGSGIGVFIERIFTRRGGDISSEDLERLEEMGYPSQFLGLDEYPAAPHIVQDPIAAGPYTPSRPTLPDGRVIRVI